MVALIKLIWGSNVASVKVACRHGTISSRNVIYECFVQARLGICNRMTIRLLSRQFLAIVCLLSSAGICAPTLDRLCESKVDIPWAVFSKTGQGWRVDKLQQPVPRIFGGLAVGDLIQRVGKNDLTHADAISASRILASPALEVLGARTLVQRHSRKFTLTGQSTIPAGLPTIFVTQGSDGFPVLQVGNANEQAGLPKQGDTLLEVNGDTLAPLQHLDLQEQADFPAPVTITFQHSGRRLKRKFETKVRLLMFPRNTLPDQEPGIVSPGALPVLEALGGRHFSLRRKWTLLHFWATWCAPCIAEMPKLQQLAASEPELMIVMPIFSDKEDAVRAFLSQHPMALPVVAESSALNRQFAVTGVPHDVLLAPDGSANLVDIGAVNDWTELISQVYGRCSK